MATKATKALDALEFEELSWEFVSGREDHNGQPDPRQRYRLYRLCIGDDEPDLVATVATPAAAGVALVKLGNEGEWEDCPVGLLDSFAPPGKRWIFRPWLPGPANVAQAGRMLRRHQDVRSKPVAANCPTCRNRVRLTKDGRIFKHRTDTQQEFEYCASSGQVHPMYVKGVLSAQGK